MRGIAAFTAVVPLFNWFIIFSFACLSLFTPLRREPEWLLPPLEPLDPTAPMPPLRWIRKLGGKL